MSEKALRGYADHKIGCHISAVGEYDPEEGRKVPCSCGFEKVVADDPDVVGVLREIAEWRAAVKSDLASARREGHADEGMIALALGKETVLRDLARTIEFMFHVRLTDDGGYEWTD